MKIESQRQPRLSPGGVPGQWANVRSEVLLCERIVKAGILYLRGSHWKKQRTFLLRDLRSRSIDRAEDFLLHEDIQIPEKAAALAEEMRSRNDLFETGSAHWQTFWQFGNPSVLADVVEFLENEGYEIECQHGAGKYRLDIIVRERGRSLLTIECDGAGYHSSFIARTRDRARQRILEKQGWRFHRVWSTNWWHFEQQEKDAIIAAINSSRSKHSSRA